MKTPICMLIALCVAATGLIGASGCADKAIYRQAAESGWNNWEKDRRPVIADDEYNAMTPDQRKMYLPQSKVDARVFERDQALSLLDE